VSKSCTGQNLSATQAIHFDYLRVTYCVTRIANTQSLHVQISALHMELQYPGGGGEFPVKILNKI
jgi:hypothetical protein